MKTGLRYFFFLLFIGITTAQANPIFSVVKIQLENSKFNRPIYLQHKNEQRDFFLFKKRYAQKEYRFSFFEKKQNSKKGFSNFARHLFFKNGAAGLSANWIHNYQLTLGWRYQPFRIMVSEKPINMHPLVIRIRKRF